MRGTNPSRRSARRNFWSPVETRAYPIFMSELSHRRDGRVQKLRGIALKNLWMGVKNGSFLHIVKGRPELDFDK